MIMSAPPWSMKHEILEAAFPRYSISAFSCNPWSIVALHFHGGQASHPDAYPKTNRELKTWAEIQHPCNMVIGRFILKSCFLMDTFCFAPQEILDLSVLLFEVSLGLEYKYLWISPVFLRSCAFTQNLTRKLSFDLPNPDSFSPVILIFRPNSATWGKNNIYAILYGKLLWQCSQH